MTEVQKKARTLACYFLQEIQRRANCHADVLDPKRKRDYGSDDTGAILRALDGVCQKVDLAIHVAQNEGWIPRETK